jgi:hypothetical protein
MPLVRKMTAEEIDELKRKEIASRQAIAALYDDLLSGVTIGDEIELELDPDEHRQTVCMRLRAAAARRSPPIRLSIERSRDPLLVRFVVQGTEPAAVAQPATPARPAAPAPDIADQLDLVEPQPAFLNQPQRPGNRDVRRPYSSRYGAPSSNSARHVRGARSSGSRPGGTRYGATPGRPRPEGPTPQRDRRRPR